MKRAFRINVLAVFVLFKVPESPRWLALQRREGDGAPKTSDVRLGEIFSPAIRRTTMLGILLATIPLFGGWGVGNWANAWASEIGDRAQTEKVADENPSEAAEQNRPKKADPRLKSWAVIARSLPGSISSLLGGALAFWLGRRRSYFLLSLCALICTQFLFRTTEPGTPEFFFWIGALGFFSGFFFGWLPLCLPELFPTRVRSTGAGVSFNWGRIVTGLGVLATAAVLKESLSGKYDVVGQYTGFIYALGMVIILLTPDTSGKELEERRKQLSLGVPQLGVAHRNTERELAGPPVLGVRLSFDSRIGRVYAGPEEREVNPQLGRLEPEPSHPIDRGPRAVEELFVREEIKKHATPARPRRNTLSVLGAELENDVVPLDTHSPSPPKNWNASS